MEATQVYCSQCGTIVDSNDRFCSKCGYPENGTIEDKNKYDHSIKLKKDILEDGKRKLKNVKIIIYIIAGFNAVFGIYYLTQPETFAEAISSFIATGLFIGCAIWVNKQPLVGVIAAFVLWILIQLSVVLVDPTLLFKGIIIKVIFVGIFIKGISSAKDAKKYTEQLNEMNAI